MLRTLRNLFRLLAIARTLARHDALFIINAHPVGNAVVNVASLIWRQRQKSSRRPGKRLAQALTELGPSFIKLGQALSTRPDLLGDTLTADLSQLQDRLPAFPFSEVKTSIEKDFERPIEKVFSSIDKQAIAAASIAQVHFAVTTEGQEVAIKVLRPKIKEAFAKDLDLFYWLAELVNLTQPKIRRLRPLDVVRKLEETMLTELDLRFEAAAAEELAENFSDDPDFVVPAVDWQRTTEHVLTLERMSGHRIDTAKDLAEMGLDPTLIVKLAAEIFFKMVFRDGFFHADMHPGNLFITSEGKIIAMDFGIMGRVDRTTRKILGEMLLGFVTRDYNKVAEVHIRAGYVPTHKSIEAFAQACRSIAEPILGKPMNEISLARLLGQLFQITEKFEMETQPQLLLLQKSMLLTEGVGRKLAPDVNMWELARPMIENWMRSELGPEARVRDLLSDAAASLEKLPHMVDKLGSAAEQIRGAGLKLHPRTAETLAGTRPSRNWAVWTPWVLVAMAIAIVAFN